MELILSINRGIIKTTEKFVRTPELMSVFLYHFRIIEMKFDYWTGLYMILCESELFEDIKEGENVPSYEILMKRQDDKTIIVTEVNRY